MEGKESCAQQEASKSCKVKPRPPKLKNPVESALQGQELSHRPIGTPPPASLRRSRQSFDLSSASEQLIAASTPSPTLDCFPRIQVLNSPEADSAACPAPSQAPSQPPHANSKRPPIDNQRRSMSVDNNNPVESPKGLTPPQRLVTRDQDGVVFELSSALHPDNN